MATELKPCPFCGGKAERVVKVYAGKYYYIGVVNCISCGCEIRQKISMGSWIKNPEREAKRRVTRLWNRRVEDGKID